MLFILRKLRRLELRKKSGQYFLYAFGEIVLIVLGILIALQINNWNDKRIQAVQEKELINNLLEELENVRESNLQEIKFLDIQLEHLTTFVSKGESVDVAAFVAELSSFWALDHATPVWYLFDWANQYRPQTKIYTAALNDGSVNLISDDDLLQQLDSIFVGAPTVVNEWHQDEIEINKSIQDHIAVEYRELFTENSSIREGRLDDETSLRLLKETLKDGLIRYKLLQKVDSIKNKKGRISAAARQADRVLQTYKQD
jgi:hypothetical protein